MSSLQKRMRRRKQKKWLSKLSSKSIGTEEKLEIAYSSDSNDLDGLEEVVKILLVQDAELREAILGKFDAESRVSNTRLLWPIEEVAFKAREESARNSWRQSGKIPVKDLWMLSAYELATVIRRTGRDKVRRVARQILGRTDIDSGKRRDAVKLILDEDSRDRTLSKTLLATLASLWNDEDQDKQTAAWEVLNYLGHLGTYHRRKWFKEATRQVVEDAARVCASASPIRGADPLGPRVNGAVGILGELGGSSELPILEGLLLRVLQQIESHGPACEYVDDGFVRGHRSANDTVQHIQKQLSRMRRRTRRRGDRPDQVEAQDSGGPTAPGPSRPQTVGDEGLERDAPQGTHEAGSLHAKGEVGSGEGQRLGDTSAQTILDRASGLMWQAVHPNRRMAQDEAIAYCSQLDLDGYSDWRLPSLRDFRTLQGSIWRQLSKADDVFWTSSDDPVVLNPSVAYTHDGISFYRTNRYYVRAVRDHGESHGAHQGGGYAAGEDGCVQQADLQHAAGRFASRAAGVLVATIILAGIAYGLYRLAMWRHAGYVGLGLVLTAGLGAVGFLIEHREKSRKHFDERLESVLSREKNMGVTDIVHEVGHWQEFAAGRAKERRELLIFCLCMGLVGLGLLVYRWIWW